MSELLIVAIVFAAAGVCVWLPTCWLLARLANHILGMTGVTLRERARDRRDAMGFVQQTAELVTGELKNVIEQHARERHAQRQLDASVDMQEIRAKQPPPEPQLDQPQYPDGQPSESLMEHMSHDTGPT